MDFPILGITPDQIQYTEQGLRYGYYLFELIAGKDPTGEKGLYYLALTAGMIGTVLLLLNPKFQKLPIIASWIFLIFVTIIGPFGSSIFFYRDNTDTKSSYVKGFNPQVVALHTFSTLHAAVYNALFDCTEDEAGKRTCSVVDPIARAFNAGDLSLMPEMTFADGALPAEVALYEAAGCGRAAKDIPLLPSANQKGYAQYQNLLMPPEKSLSLRNQGFTLGDIIKSNEYFFGTANINGKSGRPPYAVAFSEDQYKAFQDFQEITDSMEGREARAVFDLNQSRLERNITSFQGDNIGSYFLEPEPSQQLSDSQPYSLRANPNNGDIWTDSVPTYTDGDKERPITQHVVLKNLTNLPVKVAPVRKVITPTGEQTQNIQLGVDWDSITLEQLIANSAAGAAGGAIVGGGIFSIPAAVGGALLGPIVTVASAGGVIEAPNYSFYGAGKEELESGKQDFILTCGQLYRKMRERVLTNVASNLGMGLNDFRVILATGKLPKDPTESQQTFANYYADTYNSQPPDKRNQLKAAAETEFAVLTLAVNKNKSHFPAFLTDQSFQDVAEQDRQGLQAEGGLFSTLGTSILGSIAGLMAEIGVKVGAIFVGAEAVVYIQFLKLLVNMALLSILIVTPLIYLMGILIPGYAPGIIIITIGAVVILKMVPVTYTLIDAILRIMSDVLASISGGGSKWFQLDQALLVHAAAALYTSIVGITLFIMFKIGDPSSLQQLTQLDNQAKDIASKAEKAVQALAITTAAVGTAGLGAAVGVASGRMGLRAAAVQTFQPITRSASNIPVVGDILREGNPLNALDEGIIMQEEFYDQGGKGYIAASRKQRHDQERARMNSLFELSHPNQQIIQSKNKSESIFESQKGLAKGLRLDKSGDPSQRYDADGKLQKFELRYIDAARVNTHGLMADKKNEGLKEEVVARKAEKGLQEIMRHEAETGQQVFNAVEVIDQDGEMHVGYQINMNTGYPRIDNLAKDIADNFKAAGKGLERITLNDGSTISNFRSSSSFRPRPDARPSGGHIPDGPGGSSPLVKGHKPPPSDGGGPKPTPSGGGGGSSSGGDSGSSADLKNAARDMAESAKAMRDAARDMKNMQNMSGYASNRPVHRSAVVKKKK